MPEEQHTQKKHQNKSEGDPVSKIIKSIIEHCWKYRREMPSQDFLIEIENLLNGIAESSDDELTQPYSDEDLLEEEYTEEENLTQTEDPEPKRRRSSNQSQKPY